MAVSFFGERLSFCGLQPTIVNVVGSRFEPQTVQRFKGSTVQRQRGRIGVFIPGILPWPIYSNYSVVERLNLELPYLRARADVDSGVGE
jgi:hypothetical protein